MSTALETTDTALDQLMGFSTDGQQYLTFMLEEESYGIEILRVQEIKGYTGVTRIPNTPDYIKGILNLRGTIVPIVDLRMKFGLDPIEYNKLTVIIVVDVCGRTMGIIVDEVSDVLSFPDKDIKPAPEFGRAVDVSFISGIGRMGEKLVTLLALDHVLSGDEIERMEVAA